MNIVLNMVAESNYIHDLVGFERLMKSGMQSQINLLNYKKM